MRDSIVKSPQVAVIISVYNGQEFIAECIESILSQTFMDFELIIVDDASTDETLSVIKEYVKKDSRIRHARNEVNSERCFSRNRAVSMATADLIAVMDADDVALPDRLEKQVAFMRGHSDVAVLGGAMEGYENRQPFVAPSERLPVKLLFNSVISHPTCMFQKKAFQRVGGYDESNPLAEDYNLWVSFAREGYLLANIPDVLIRYRTHPNKQRAVYKESLRQSMNMVWRRQLFFMGIDATPLELDIHGSCASLERDIPWRIRQVKSWLQKIQKANTKKGYIPASALEEECEAMLISLAEPLSFLKEPFRYLIKLSLHCFITSCRCTGKFGESLEKSIRIMKDSMKHW